MRGVRYSHNQHCHNNKKLSWTTSVNTGGSYTSMEHPSPHQWLKQGSAYPLPPLPPSEFRSQPHAPLLPPNQPQPHASFDHWSSLAVTDVWCERQIGFTQCHDEIGVHIIWGKCVVL